MQNPSAVRAKSRAAAVPAGATISWSFILLVIVCACVVAAGFFFAARQHFTSMEFGLKNSTLREQIQNLETEKRRLLLAREVALSPLAIRKAARSVGLHQNSEIATAIPVVAKTTNEKPAVTAVKVSKTETTESVKPSQTVVRTVLSNPVQQKTADTRPRVVDSSKDRKEKTEVAALLKLR
jgi:hypothetical protein